jgi:hypothetical protein
MEKEKDNILENEVVGIKEEPGTHDHFNDLDSVEGDHDQLEHSQNDGAEAEISRSSIDFSSFSKNDFVQLLKELSVQNNFRRIDELVKEAKPLYDEIRQKERAAALERFKGEGGTDEDFDYKQDEQDIVFDATLRLIRDRRASHYKALEEEKNENYRKKIELLEKVRSLIDGEDTEQGFQQFKELQREWRSVGAVPAIHAKNLWASYHALVDLFYDHRSIYFELKELDRRKNLAAKLDLCSRAERLLEVANISDAVRELNELHNEFKHIGPVPIEEKENVWHRFKTASDAIYSKRDQLVANLHKEFQDNLLAKEKLIEEVLKYSAFKSDRIKEWNQKTQEILDIQKQWEKSGGVARNKAREVNRKFWSAFKSFFATKSTFFKKIDDERQHNLAAKSEIVKKAQEIKASTDWDRTANELKELQRQWREIGPVPEKFREKVFQEFKEACDYFFDQRRVQFEKVDTEQEQNLLAKEKICVDLEQTAQEMKGTPEQLSERVAQFNALGFVPKKSINSIKSRFQTAVEKYMESLHLTEEDRDRLLLEIQLQSLKDDPEAERKIYHKEQAIRKRIMKVENDIALWKNNIEFFGRSKNADKLKDEFNEKIKDASDQLKQLQNQLKMLKTVS